MTTFNRSLPDALLLPLEEKVKELSMPKNKAIDTALSLYFVHLNKTENEIWFLLQQTKSLPSNIETV